jgi:hypothetical protein
VTQVTAEQNTAPAQPATFSRIVEAVRVKKGLRPFTGRLLALDPGETTGWSLWENNGLVDCGQKKTWPLTHAIDSFQELLTLHPTIIVFESYQVYEHKLEEHTWSRVPTIQVIGCLKTLVLLHGRVFGQIPYTTQTAQVAKGFCTDDKLKQWGFWQQGMRHARDSIRHGAYYLLFGPLLSPGMNPDI